MSSPCPVRSVSARSAEPEAPTRPEPATSARARSEVLDIEGRSQRRRGACPEELVGFLRNTLCPTCGCGVNDVDGHFRPFLR